MATLAGMAEFDDGRTYRYVLRRFLTAPDPTIPLDLDTRDSALFLMLNPSIASGDTDDPTLLACVDFVRHWNGNANHGGFDTLVLCNLFAMVGTDPRDLMGKPDPVGPHNDEHLARELRRARIVICAWGQNASKIDPTRPPKVKQMVRDLAPSKSFALVINKDGSPKHPLYVKRTTSVVRFP